MANSRYATLAEIESVDFQKINREINSINQKYNLTDHSELNKVRYPWSQKYLAYPQFYASRLWEYPWAILASDLKPGMKCADIGCGESPFTVYLKEVSNCLVTGFDPDVHSGTNINNFGASDNFIKKSGLNIVQNSMDSISAEDNSFDRVYCLSVIEHIRDFNIRSKGMREMARILKPGGLAIITVDVNLFMRLSNPLELIWESGLTIKGDTDLLMPEKRLGIFCDGRQPADVFGFVLRKHDRMIDINYGDDSEKIEHWKSSYCRDKYPMPVSEKFIRINPNWSPDKRPDFFTLCKIARNVLLRKYPGL